MSPESPHYHYRLGFRYSSKPSDSQHGRRNTAASSHHIQRLRQSKADRQSYIHRPLRAAVSSNPSAVGPRAGAFVQNAWGKGREPQVRAGRDLAAIQVQRAVRGWRARVLAVKLVHDRAWRALLLIQAIWRGALVRHKLQAVLFKEACTGKKAACFRDTRNQRSKRKKQQSPSGTQPHERCPERAAWQQSWRRVCRERPDFRDRVRVWQSIAELKRAGGQGRMGITNNEAYGALRDSSGNASVAANLLASEEYLLGRRLQNEKGRQGLDEVPPFLSLARDVRPGIVSSGERPSSAGVQHREREPGVGRGGGDIFESVSSLFYSVPRGTTRR